ncbi:MAG: toll/interleukin-1 receptor domain-containing protein [bacterium]
MKPSVFLSHSSADKAIARRLFGALTDAGVRVWLDEREIRVGDDILDTIERGVKESDYVALLLTPRSIKSRWVMEELNAFRMAQVDEGRKRVLPLLFEDCDLPPLLKSKKYADFRNDFSSGLRELLYSLGIDKFPKPVSQVAHEDLLSNLSIIWDTSGKYRGKTWPELRSQVERTRGGIAILTEDLLEMVEYKSAPFREKAWKLRDTFRELISGASIQDADMLARVVIAAWEDHRDNINAAWLLVLMPKPLAAAVFCKAYERSPGTARWLFRTVYDFVVDPKADELVFEVDLIKQAGDLPAELKDFRRDDM